MTKAKAILVCLLLVISLANAQELEFGLLRQNDELESLEEKEEKTLYENLKLKELGENSFLSIGGSYRGQFEFFKNEEFEESPTGDSKWYLQRLLLHTTLQLNNNLRFFGELGSSLIYGKDVLSPVDRNELYVNQLFLEYTNKDWSITVGRENLMLGSRRLIDVREGPNVRRSFDHVTLAYQMGVTRFSALAATQTFPQPGVFDNRTLHGEEYLWGLYAEEIIHRDKFKIDLSYLGVHYDEQEYELGVGTETRHSLSARLWDLDGSWGFDNEAVLQFGSFANTNILAWTVSFNVWKNIERQKLGLKTELISGDNADSDNLNTFNPLFPRGAYFGRVARFGPSNLIDIHPYWNISVGKFFMEIDYDVFWRYSTTDAVYGAAGEIVLPSVSQARFIAQQIGTLFNYEPNPFIGLELETNYILSGNYIREAVEEDGNLFHLVFTAQLRF